MNSIPKTISKEFNKMVETAKKACQNQEEYSHLERIYYRDGLGASDEKKLNMLTLERNDAIEYIHTVLNDFRLRFPEVFSDFCNRQLDNNKNPFRVEWAVSKRENIRISPCNISTIF